VSVRGYDEPDESEQRIDVGGVMVICGTDHGLDVDAAQPYQGAPGVAGAPAESEEFGAALPGSGTYDD